MNTRIESFGYPFKFIAGKGLGFSYSSYTQVSTLLPYRDLGRAKIECLCNVTNGNLVILDKKISMPAISGRVEFSYIYNSLNRKGWYFSYGRNLQSIKKNENMIVKESDSHETIYVYIAEKNLYAAPGHSNGTPYIQPLDDETWHWYHPESRQHEYFNPEGYLTKTIDYRGNETHYEYDPDKNLIAIKTAESYYEIVRSLQKVEIYLHANEAISLVHTYLLNDEMELIKSITFDHYEICYHYAENSKIKSIHQSDESHVDFTFFDENQKLKSIQVGSEENPPHYFEYENTRCIFTNALKIPTIFTLDSQSRLATIIEERGFENASKTLDITQYGYDSYGHNNKIIYPDLSAEAFNFDLSTGLLDAKIHRDGMVTEYRYEGIDQPLLSLLSQAKSGTRAETRYVYQKFKENFYVLAFEISPNGSVKEYQLDHNTGLTIVENAFSEFYSGESFTLHDLINWCGTQKNITSIQYSRDHHGQIVLMQQIDDKVIQETKLSYDLFGYVKNNAIKYDNEDKNAYFSQLHVRDGCHHFISEMIGVGTSSEQITTRDFKGNTTHAILPNATRKVDLYHSSGLLKSAMVVVDHEDNSESRVYELFYDGNGRVETIVLPDKQEIIHIYDRQNRLSFIISPVGAVTEFIYFTLERYEVKRQYAQLIDPTLILSNGKYSATTLKALLDEVENAAMDRQTLEFNDVAGRKQFIIDAENYLTEYRYDALGRLGQTIQYCHPLSEDEINNFRNRDIPDFKPHRNDDRITSIFHDNMGEIIAEQDPAGYVTHYQRDARQLVTCKTLYSVPVASTSLHYDEIAPLATPQDSKTYYFYNTLKQCTLEVDAEGYITEHRYYCDNKKELSIRYATSVSDAWYEDTSIPPAIIRHIKDQVTQYGYDALRHQTQVLTSTKQLAQKHFNNMNQVLSTDYMDLNHPNEITGDYRRREESRFDGWNQVIALATPRISEKLLSIALQDLSEEEKNIEMEKIWENDAEKKYYSESGLHTLTIDENGYATLFYYDRERRPVLRIDPMGSVFKQTYHAFGEVISETQYAKRMADEEMENLMGGYLDEKIKKILEDLEDPAKDSVTVYERDRRGQIIKKIDPESHVYHYQYSAFKQCIHEKIPISDDIFQEIQHVFDSRGLEIETTKISGRLKSSIFRKYDVGIGKETEIMDEVGLKIIKNYDRLFRLRATIKVIEDDKEIIHQIIDYDAFNRPIQKTNAAGFSITFDYNDETRSMLTSYPIAHMQSITTDNVFGEIIETINGTGAKEKFFHEADGQLKERMDGLGSIKKTIYNNKGQIHQEINPNNMITEYRYCSSGPLSKKVQDKDGLNLVTQYVTNVLGKNEKIIDPRGITTIQQFDKMGQLNKTNIDPAGLHLQKTYQYNAANLPTDIYEGDEKEENKFHYQQEYDGFKRVTATIVDPENLKLIKKIVFDNAGNPITEIDANGLLTRRYFDLQQQKRFELQMIDSQHISAIEWGYTVTNKLKFSRIYQMHIDVNIITDQTQIKDVIDICKPNTNDTVSYFYYDTNDQERFKLKMLYSPEEKVFYGMVEEKRYDFSGRPIVHIRYATSFIIPDISLFSTEVIEDILKNIQHPNEDRATYTWYDDANEERFVIDQNGSITEKAYDRTGKVIFHRQYAIPIDNPALLIGMNEYELAAHVERSTLDRTTYFVYDSLGFEIFKIDPNGGVTRTDYDENHNIIATTLFSEKILIPEAYDQLVEDLKTFIPNPACDSITRKSYNNNNQPIILTDALGNKELLEYDSVGNNTHMTNRSNQLTRFIFDNAKRKILEIYPMASYTSVMQDEKGRLQYKTTDISPQKSIEYDKANNKTRIVISDGKDEKRMVISEYNAYSQTTKTLIPGVKVNDEKATYHHSWEKLLALPNTIKDLMTLTHYDTKRNIVAEMDENENWNYSVYDSLNRLIFFIDREGALSRFFYNSFDEVIEEIRYAKPISFNLEKNRDTGLTSEIILENIQTDENDRVTYFHRNQLGKLSEQISPQVFYYSRDEYGFANPTMRWEYNTFGDNIYEAKSIRPNVWSEKRFWHDNMQNIIAEINENNYLTFYTFNTSNKPIEMYEYSDPFIIQPDASTDFTALKKIISPSAKDRIYRYTYDLLQQRKTEILFNVATESLMLDEKNIPHIVHNPSKNLVKEWFFSATQKILAIKHPDGNIDKFYYDTADNKIAETKALREYKNEKGDTVSLLPMKQFKNDIFGKVNVTLTSPLGGIIEEDMPLLIESDQQSIIEEITLFDNRGLASLVQDGEQHLTGFTYTPARKVARQLQEASNWPSSMDAKTTPVRVYFINEKEIDYNFNNQPLLLNYRRNGNVVESTHNQYNTFGDLIGEGPVSDNYPAFSFYDNLGNPWFTNTERGINHIILRDLRGIETLRLAAPKDNLESFPYSMLATLLSWGPERVDRTEMIHDSGGNVIAQKLPIWFKDRNVQPSRSYRHDRWNNVVKETNSLGHETDYSFNHLDKLSECIQPEVDVYLENMTKMRKRPFTLYGHNDRGFEIGFVDANENVTGYILDSSGNCLNKILADGTWDESAIYDALDRPTYVSDSRKKTTQFIYDAKNSVVAQYLPSLRLMKYEYDELGNRSSYSNPAGNVWRFNYDVKNNVVQRFMPLGQSTTLSYDRNYVKMSEINPDESKMIWDVDYFGNILKHTDLSGKILNHVYDFNKKEIHQFSQNDMSRKMLIMNSPVISCGWVAHNYKFSTVTSENFEYRYRYGLLDTVQDNSLNKLTVYGYNTECKRTSTQNKKSDVMMNDIVTQYDELDREISTNEKIFEGTGYYSLVNSNKGYDGVGNIRMNIFKLTPTCINATYKCMSPEQKSAFYHLYDSADRIRLLSGKFVNGRIEQGISLEYKEGFRAKENVYGVGTVLFDYDDDGRLVLTNADNGMKTMRIYDVSGWTRNYQETLGSKTTVRKLNFNENGWQLLDDFFENNVQQTSMSFLNFTALGLPKNQSIYDYKNKYNDMYDITYLGLDRWVQAKVTGIRNGSQNIGTAELWFDSHGMINGKSYATQDEPQYKASPDTFSNKFPLYYETTQDGLILTKAYVTQDSTKAFEHDYFYHYLHNAQGDLYGGYYFLYDSSYNYVHPGTPNHSSYYFPKVSDVYAYHLPQSLAFFKIQDKNKAMDPSWNEITSDIVPFSPQIYIVNQGDTFASIAKKMFGDHRYGDKIANMNGMIHVSAPKQGLLLELPQIIPERNKFDTTFARPYHMFIDYLTGNLLPKFQGYQHRHKHHHRFWGSLIKIVAVGLIIIFAPHLGGVLLGLSGIAIGATSSAIAAGVAAAMMDAAAQGLAIMTGLQSQFSFAEVLETAVSAGAFIGMDTSPSLMAAAKAALRVGTVQVATQLVEMGAGMRHKFDVRAVGLQIAGTLAGFQMSKLENTNSILLRNIATTALNAVLDRAINNTSFNIENIALQMAGGVITEFSSSLISNHPTTEAMEVSSNSEVIQEVSLSPELKAAENTAKMTLPKAKLDFQNISGEDIRKSRMVRWQKESAKRSTWADKHPASPAKNLIEQITHQSPAQNKGFMDYVRDFNNTVESMVVKPTLAMGDAIIQDVNTLIYNESVGAKLFAAGNLAVDGAMVFGLPEINLGKAALSSLSKFGLWGRGVKVEGYTNYGINNHINRLRLQQQLSIEEQQTLFNSTFGLSEEAIKNSRLIVPGKNLKNPKLINELSMRGGELQDWGKYTTESMHTLSGKAEIHFYRNPITADVYYGRDYKSVFNHQGTWKIEITPKFSYEPIQYK